QARALSAVPVVLAAGDREVPQGDPALQPGGSAEAGPPDRQGVGIVPGATAGCSPVRADKRISEADRGSWAGQIPGSALHRLGTRIARTRSHCLGAPSLLPGARS